MKLISGAQPKKALFRIYRDVRFAKDKSPYKTNLGLSFNGATKTEGSKSVGYYLHIEPGASFLGIGSYHPAREELAAIRQEIDYNLEEFQGIVSDKAFSQLYERLEGDRLSRPPKGYSDDNPAIEYLKYKDFIVSHPLTDDTILKKNLAEYAIVAFKGSISLQALPN